MILDGSNGVTFNDSSLQGAAASPFGLKNRIINGDMVIDQRNAGASVTPNNSYTLDRWLVGNSQTSKLTVQQNAGSVTPPAGFTNYLGITSSSAYSVLTGDYFSLQTRIEGLNIADLSWGTANAKTITLSFWVRSSLTGTFGGALNNNGSTRSYPFTYTISSANTWTNVSVTIAGDTSGTWLTTNGIGITVLFGLGVGTTYSGTAGAWAATNYVSATGATSVVGTNGATFYITGVQLERNTTATPFERRMFGNELALCQRYYYRTTPSATFQFFGSGFVESTTTAFILTPFLVSMRVAPTALEQSGTASHYGIRRTGASATACSAVPSFERADLWSASTTFTVASGLTGGQCVFGRNDSASGYLGWSAEL